MNRAIIVAAGGDLPPDSDHHRYITDLLRPDDLLVAVNGGSSILQHLGIAPQLLIGDLDSLADEDSMFSQDDSSPRIITFPRDKDMTDTELAVRHLLQGESPAGEIIICGAFGGRVDHELALILYAASVSEQVSITLTDGRQRAFCIDKRATVEGRCGQTASFVPLTPEVTGIHLTGFAYPLAGDTLSWRQTLGVSNVLTDPPGLVEIRGVGKLFAIVHTGEVD